MFFMNASNREGYYILKNGQSCDGVVNIFTIQLKRVVHDGDKFKAMCLLHSRYA